MGVECEVSGAGGTATVKFNDASGSSLPKGTCTAIVTIPIQGPIGHEDGATCLGEASGLRRDDVRLAFRSWRGPAAYQRKNR